MATPLYVNDGGNNTDGVSWANAYNSLDDGLLNVDAGGVIYIASNHVETEGANYTLGSANNNITVISVQESTTTYETMATGGGSVNAGANFDLIFTNSDIYVGLTLTAGDNVTLGTASKTHSFINVTFNVDDIFLINSDTVVVIFDNVTYVQETSGQITMNGGGIFLWRGGSFSHGVAGLTAAQLISIASGVGGRLIVEDVDIQDLDAADYLVNGVSSGWEVLFKRCKVPAALGGFMSAAPTGSGFNPKFHSISDTDGIYKFEERFYEGQVNEDTGVYLDATYDGTNGYSAKMVSSANSKVWSRPLRFKLADIYIDATGKTLTVELLTTDGAAAETLHTDDFWIEVEYPDSTTKALGNVLSTRETIPNGGTTELTASAKGAGDWTGELANNNFYKCAADFTGVADEAIGVYTVWACLAKPSTTVYVCPKIVVI